MNYPSIQSPFLHLCSRSKLFLCFPRILLNQVFLVFFYCYSFSCTPTALSSGFFPSAYTHAIKKICLSIVSAQFPIIFTAFKDPQFSGSKVTVISDPQRRAIIELFMDAGAPLTSLILPVMVKSISSGLSQSG